MSLNTIACASVGERLLEDDEKQKCEKFWTLPILDTTVERAKVIEYRVIDAEWEPFPDPMSELDPE